MENNKYVLTFKTSVDEDSKKSGESITTTTTIIFDGWTDEDFKAAAAETVKIRQIQPRLRKGQDVGLEFKASRPGTRGAVIVDYAQALVKLLGGDVAYALIKRHGTAEKAYQAIKPKLDLLMAGEVEEDEE